jgi:uncharacterized membrane protein
MIRFALYILGGVLLGGVIHIVVILSLPLLAEERPIDVISRLGPPNTLFRIDAADPAMASEFSLDPLLLYATCRVDLSDDPAFVRGLLPDAFWSVAVYDPVGTVVYSTTNRDGIGRRLELGLFNAAQTRLLAQQQIDIAEGVLIVETTRNDLFVVVRLAPPNSAAVARFSAALDAITCGPDAT